MPMLRNCMFRYLGQLVTAILVLLCFILLKNAAEPPPLWLIICSGICAVVFAGWRERFCYLIILGLLCCFERHFILHYGDTFRTIGSQALITLRITNADEIKAYMSIFKIVEPIQLLLFAGGCAAEWHFRSPPLFSAGTAARRIFAATGKLAAPLTLAAAAVYQIVPPITDHLKIWDVQQDFFLTRRDFSFHAFNRDRQTPIFCILVIGESHRKDEFDRLAFRKNTTAPKLMNARERGVLFEFDDMISHYQHTWFSVFTLLTRRGEDDRNVLWPEKGLISLFREAGFRTAYLTYQKKTPDNLGYNYVVNEADTYINHREFSGSKFDHGMLPPLAGLMKSAAPHQLAVLKMSGVHFHYNSRYTREFRFFTPCYDSSPGSRSEYRIEDREKLVNTYRNAMAFSLTFFDEVMKLVDRHPTPAVMVFISDHGVINYDDGRNAFFGGAKSNFHIPCFIYGNAAFRKRLPPEQERALRKNRSLPVTNSYIFDTLVSLARIGYPEHRPEMDLTSELAKPAADRMVWVWDKRMHYNRLP